MYFVSFNSNLWFIIQRPYPETFNVTRQQPQLLCPKWCNLAKWNQQWVDQCSTVQKIQMHINHVLKKAKHVVAKYCNKMNWPISFQQKVPENSLEMNFLLLSLLSLPFCCALREACKQLVGMGWSWHQLWWSFSTRWNREPPCQSLSRRICFFCFGFNVPSDTFTVKLQVEVFARKCTHKHCNIEVVAC